jgi:hypothetical protein
MFLSQKLQKEKTMSWRLVALLTVSGAFALQASSASAHHAKRLWRATTASADVGYLQRPYRNYEYVGWSYMHHSPGRWVYFGPSYTYVPGKGIVDEACNLPTSACPNSQRDAN